MYPILILRSELVCLVILIFLFFMSRSYNVDSESVTFKRILRFAVCHVIFDIVTVLTVNHVDVLPLWLNWICHVFFYLSAILYSGEIANYVVAICYPRQARKLYAVGHILTLVYLFCLSFLKIEYVADLGTYSSAGPAAIVGYGLAFTFFISALVIMFTHMNMMSGPIKSALIPMMLVLMITEICQVIWRSVLFTGAAITIVTVGLFFSLENPVAVFRKKAMTDALTGVRSRSSYEEDIEKYDMRFREKPESGYIFVFFDLNDLRSVNNRFGHAEGDNYITLIASAINRCMKHATTVYRIGGDEFLILYYQSSVATVEKEICELREECEKSSAGLSYTASVSAGYAQSSESYRSLRDVVKSADYAMYQNKARIKGDNSYEGGSLGTSLNYSGLTDSMFEAICASNDRCFPFMTNLDTGVTRISPAWKEYFGLDSEFYADFNAVWKDRVQPDYFEGYTADIVAVINGRKKYHNYDYLAKLENGEYIHVSCHGSVYHDASSGSTFFSGFLLLHNTEEHCDPLTGLQNFAVLENVVSQRMDEGRPFSIMKLKINNFARVNMLYGYNGGNEVVECFSKAVVNELGSRGEAYSENGVNITLLLDTCEELELELIYRRFVELSTYGVKTSVGTVPLLLSGGAVINPGERRTVDKLRACLVFALEESHYNRRNQLVFYHENDENQGEADISLLSKIHADALAEMKYFRLRYQPIVDITAGKTTGAEALIRWVHPDYGEIPPSQFIAFLENDPCYYRLGLFILEQAVKDAAMLRKRIPGFRINVNITALQLQNENFPNHVFEILDKYHYAPDGLVLELTERCKEMDGDFLAKKIAELRERGILIAFDDLGTGYSTISLLMDIPVDEIKLDRNFVRDMGKRESYKLFVKALVLGSSSQGYGYNICLEGIEDEEMLDFVSRFGNFLAQGYYFAKPLLIEDLTKYLESRS